MRTRAGFFSSVFRAVGASFSSGRVRLWGRRILRGAAAALALFVAGLCLWLLMPMKSVPQADLLPRFPFGFMSFAVDPESPAFEAILARASRGHGPVKNALARVLLPAALPDSILVVLSADGATGRPETLVLVRMGKIARVLKLFGRPLDRALFEGKTAARVRSGGHRFRADAKTLAGERSLRPSAYTIVGDTIVAGTSLDALKESYECSRGGRRFDETGRWLSALLVQSLAEKDAVLHVDNTGGKMTALIAEASEKYSFAAFPSIDAVSSIEGRASLRPETVEGAVVFRCGEPRRLEEVVSDVRFLYGATRRVANAAGMNMRGEVLARGSSVRFEFSMPGYTEALFAPSTPEGGEEK